MKKVLLILPVFLLFFSVSAFASTTFYVNEYSTTTTSTDYMEASTSGDGSVWTSLDVGGGSGQVIWYNFGSEIGRSSTPANGIVPPSGATSFKLTSLDGTTVYAIHGTTTNANSPDITFDTPSATFNGGLSPNGNSSDTTFLLNQILYSTDNNGHGIGHLIDTMSQVLDSTNSNGDTLKQILAQMTPTDSVQSGTVPVAPSIDDNADSRLESWKPHQNDVFTDNTTHFSDQGDTTDQATPLPSVPDPSTCWGNVCADALGVQDPTLTSDSELTKDTEQNKDAELSKDAEQNKDAELTKDNMSQDAQMSQDSSVQDSEMTKDIEQNKDAEMTKDTMSQDAQMTQDTMSQDAEMSKDAENTQTNSQTQDNFYQQDNFYNVSN